MRRFNIQLCAVLVLVGLILTACQPVISDRNKTLPVNVLAARDPEVRRFLDHLIEVEVQKFLDHLEYQALLDFAAGVQYAKILAFAAQVEANRVQPPQSAYGVWDRLAQCESGGRWNINTGNGYYGGIQFSLASWRGVGGTGYPHQHSRETQIAMGERLRRNGGWGHWPACSRKLGLR